MRLPRPYIPLKVRVQVAERQFYEMKRGDQALGFAHSIYLEDVCYKRSLSYRLAYMLGAMFGKQRVELHHRPALMNRQMVQASAKDKCKHWTIFVHQGNVMRYVPDANDPGYLIYLPVDEHDIETRVRGQGAQLSDLAIARKRKRKEKKAKAPKRRWPKRKFPKRRRK